MGIDIGYKVKNNVGVFLVTQSRSRNVGGTYVR